MEKIAIGFGLLVILSPVFAYVAYRLYTEKKQMSEFRAKLIGMPTDQKMLELSKLQSKANGAKTNHILHFLICFFTVGFWVIPWVLFTAQNNGKQKQINEMMESI